MCGIAGFAGAGDRQVLHRLTALLAHRGPDAEGFWQDEEQGVFLGHRRLSIIDLADGRQPMSTTDGELTVIFNGEIYNHLELRRELIAAGATFHTDHSDTEVLLHGWRHWGRDLSRRLNGMWAMAIYDQRRRELFLCRDRFGQKPLYYTLQGKTFVFASELSAVIAHPGVTANQSAAALRKYFAYGFIPAPWSLYEGIHKLPGGHWLSFDLATQTMQTGAYWEFLLEPFDHQPPDATEAWSEELRRLLRQAVERRLMADVPLGVFLSGGLDSSCLTAYAADIAGPDRIQSFSIGFEEASFDESIYARRVAEIVGTRHHLTMLSMEKACSLIPEILSRLDEPMGDSSLIPTWLLCRETRQHVTVALGGDGGDELFAGYDPFRAIRLAKLYDTLVPKPIHAGIRFAMARLPVSHRNMSLDFKLKRTLRGLSYPRPYWNPVWLGPLAPDELDDLFQTPTDLEEVYAEAIAAWDACPEGDLIDRTLQFYTRLYLPEAILTKVDRASMMHSLEARSPFLDIELVDFVRRLPSDLKYRHGQTKYLLKKALEPLLPEDILYRPKKGFGVPVGHWFQAGRLSLDGAHGFARTLEKRHRDGREDQRLFLWNQLVLNYF